MHQVVAFAVSLCALMCKSEQAAWNFPHEVIDSSICGYWLASCFCEGPHLPANRPDRERRSLKRQSLYRRLNHWRYNPSGSTVISRFSHKCSKSELPVLAHPPLGGPEGKVRVCGDQYQRASLLQMRLDEPKPRHRTIPSCLGNPTQLLHATTLRQIALKYYAK